MSNIIKSSQAALEYTPEQIALVKKQIAPNASPDELQLFLYQCQRTGLDALSRQIYCIHRGSKMTIQTSIDGFRVIAERSGSYAGQDEPIFEEGANGTPIKCTVKVNRFAPNGQKYCAGVGVAYWAEYAQNTPLWGKMKHTMLAKCAEALALRKAFPQDLSGLYTAEEMQQADAPVQEPIQEAEIISEVTDEQIEYLIKLLESSSYEEKQRAGLRNRIKSLKLLSEYENAKVNLLANQLGIESAQNPTMTEINSHLKKVTAN